VAFTTSPAKREEALALGAHEVIVVSRDADEMAAQTGSLDFILDTVAATISMPSSLCSSATARCAWSARRNTRTPARRCST
jgi:D-arabinose 1-dehydrogenase-like Zn-dependent alcohol dehydrogenase